MSRWLVGAVCGALLCVMIPASAPAQRRPHRGPKRGGYRLSAPPRMRSTPPARTAAAAWPRREVYDLATRAYECGRTDGQFDSPILTIIDYSLPSTEKRLWVIDLAARRILFHELVAHGQNSGDMFSVAFSNELGSRQSSLGLFRTDEVYDGRHGESLKLIGLEAGVNDRAEERKLVIHGAAYVNPNVVARFGQLGRSWGCPAVDRAVHRRIIDRIKGGTAVFAYYPDPQWLRRSEFLACRPRLAGAAAEQSTQSW